MVTGELCKRRDLEAQRPLLCSLSVECGECDGVFRPRELRYCWPRSATCPASATCTGRAADGGEGKAKARGGRESDAQAVQAMVCGKECE